MVLLEEVFQEVLEKIEPIEDVFILALLKGTKCFPILLVDGTIGCDTPCCENSKDKDIKLTIHGTYLKEDFLIEVTLFKDGFKFEHIDPILIDGPNVIGKVREILLERYEREIK